MVDWDNLKKSIRMAIKQNGNQEISGAVLQNVLINIVNEIGALLCITNENGFFIIDSSNCVSLKYDSDGFDVAKLSKHFIELIKASGLGGGNSGGDSGLIYITNENGFFVIDSSNYICLKYDSDGFDVAKLSKHFIELAKASGLGGGNNNLEIKELN